MGLTRKARAVTGYEIIIIAIKLTPGSRTVDMKGGHLHGSALWKREWVHIATLRISVGWDHFGDISLGVRRFVWKQNAECVQHDSTGPSSSPGHTTFDFDGGKTDTGKILFRLFCVLPAYFFLFYPFLLQVYIRSFILSFFNSFLTTQGLLKSPQSIKQFKNSLFLWNKNIIFVSKTVTTVPNTQLDKLTSQSANILSWRSF